MLDIKNCKALDQKRVSSLVLELFNSKPNLSEDSKKTYTKQIKVFFNYCYQKKIKKPRKQNLLEFISFSLFSGKSANYINNILVILRNFFRYLNFYEIYPDITFSIERVKSSKGHKRDALFPNQFKRILEAMPKRTVFEFRDYSIINLMGRTGLRRKAVSDLRRKDLYQKENNDGLKRWYINAKLKGHDVSDFEICLPEQAINPILEYLKLRGNIKGKEALFLNKNGTKLSPFAISILFKRSARRVGIDSPKITCHSMRHMVATVAKLNNQAMEDISDTLGHAKLSTTSDIYTHRGQEGKAKVLDLLSDILG